jgi:acylphosphatase
MKQSVILTIYGRVQGVGFRYFVKQKADLLGVNGFVRNLANGHVYIEAEGEEAALQQFIEFCRQGPSHAWVEKTEIQYCPVQGFEGFEKR